MVPISTISRPQATVEGPVWRLRDPSNTQRSRGYRKDDVSLFYYLYINLTRSIYILYVCIYIYIIIVRGGRRVLVDLGVVEALARHGPVRQLHKHSTTQQETRREKSNITAHHHATSHNITQHNKHSTAQHHNTWRDEARIGFTTHHNTSRDKGGMEIGISKSNSQMNMMIHKGRVI